MHSCRGNPTLWDVFFDSFRCVNLNVLTVLRCLSPWAVWMVNRSLSAVSVQALPFSEKNPQLLKVILLSISYDLILNIFLLFSHFLN